MDSEIVVGENEQKALTVIRAGMGIEVYSQTSLDAANGLLLDVKALRRKFDTEFDAGIAQAFQHHRYLVAQKRRWTDPLDEAEKILKPKITAYLVEQDRIRLEAERAAERARLKIEKEAADASDVAAELIKEGKSAEAEQVVDMALEKVQEIEAETPFVPSKPIANGTTLRETWNFEIENEELIPRQFLTPDLKKIRGYVQNMKRDARIAGVRIFPVKSVSASVGKY